MYRQVLQECEIEDDQTFSESQEDNKAAITKVGPYIVQRPTPDVEQQSKPQDLDLFAEQVSELPERSLEFIKKGKQELHDFVREE